MKIPSELGTGKLGSSHTPTVFISTILFAVSLGAKGQVATQTHTCTPDLGLPVQKHTPAVWLVCIF